MTEIAVLLMWLLTWMTVLLTWLLTWTDVLLTCLLTWTTELLMWLQAAGPICTVARDMGLIVITAGAGDVIRLVPPLIVTEADIDQVPIHSDLGWIATLGAV